MAGHGQEIIAIATKRNRLPMPESQPPPQQQDRRPGLETDMIPRPKSQDSTHQGTGKLHRKVALITGGDSGIGRAIAISFAREGADLVILYLDEHQDANETIKLVERENRRCMALAGDVGTKVFCTESVEKALDKFGQLDILVNNAAEQHPQDCITKISPEQLERTFRTNIFSFFYMTQAVLPHLKEGSTIINSASVTAYKGSWHLVDYASTKGAIVSFTRSLSQALAEKGIRVNAVAPGPIWTPLIPSTFSKDDMEKLGSHVPMKRVGQPEEVAPCYWFLASSESSYMTGQVLHPNGGTIVNG
jgi:NAD(P)-dependent dehydrogenase (short-subunit alcohol dehydrogenase family)